MYTTSTFNKHIQIMSTMKALQALLSTILKHCHTQEIMTRPQDIKEHCKESANEYKAVT